MLHSVVEITDFYYLCSVVGRSVAPASAGEESPDRVEQGAVESTAGGDLRQTVTENNRLKRQG